MSLPYEKKKSINYARKFLIELLNPKETPKVPRLIREKARVILRHFPWEFEVNEYWSEKELDFSKKGK